MTDNMQLTSEEKAAWRLLELATTGAVGDLSKFSSWLMTVLGAALTFFVANYEAVSTIITVTCLRAALSMFVTSMLSGLFALWLTAPIKSGLAMSAEVLELRTLDLNAHAFASAFASGLIFPYRWFFLRRLATARATDALSSIRLPARLSQYQALLVLFQFISATAVVFTLALGIKV